MQAKLQTKEDEVLKLIEAGHFLNTEAIRKAVRLMKSSDFMREFMKHDTTSEAMTRGPRRS